MLILHKFTRKLLINQVYYAPILINRGSVTIMLAFGPFMEIVSELCKLIPSLSGDELLSAFGTIAYNS